MSETDAKKLAGVIGYPVGHSRSPRIHRYWLKRYRVHGEYIALEVKRIDFRDVLRVLPKMGFRGVNVTIPHKEAALQHSDTVSDTANLIGAVNSLTFGANGAIYGDNTDSFGFIENMRDTVPEWSAATGPCLVIGAGGAARAVIQGLLTAGAPRIHVYNRTRERAELLRSDFGARVEVVLKSEIDDLLPSMATLVNTSAMGMYGKPEPDLPLQGLDPSTVVSDIVYTPLRTQFMADAETRGCRVVDGLGMLLHQASASFDSWFGVRPEVDQAARDVALSE